MGDDADQFQWWKLRADKYPRVADYALTLGLHKASSAASERQFSKAKRILTKQRLRMEDSTFESLVMCRENLPLVAALLGVNMSALRKMAHRHGDSRAALGELALRMLSE